LDRSDFEFIFTQAERFAQWANDAGRQIGIEGWR
jgi:hypothetical protein